MPRQVERGEIIKARPVQPLAATLAALALTIAACGGSAENTTPPDQSGESQPASGSADEVRTVPSIDLEDAADALLDPSTSENAVIAILDLLGVGVYDTDGTPIAPGAERNEDDLWLSTVEVAGLASAARRDPVPFARITDLLNETADTDLTTDDVAVMYAEMVETLPEHPMSRVLVALGADIGPDGEITPFEGWLLFVAMMPPIPSNEGQASASLLPAHGIRGAHAFADDCPPVGGDESDPGFGLAKDYVGEMAGSAEGAVVDELAEGAKTGRMATAGKVASWWKSASSVLSKVTEILDVSKMWAIYENIEPKLDVSKAPVHEVHDTEGKTVESERAEVVASVRWPGMGSGPGLCFASRALGLPPGGAMENAGVKFNIDDTLIKHGVMSRPNAADPARQLTDASGEASFWYEPNPERPEAAQRLGAAFEHRETGIISAEFDFAGAFEQFLNPYGAIEAVFDAFDVNVVEFPLEVEWHDAAARVTVVVDLQPPWSGAAAIDLMTCDGEAWTGSVTLDGALSVEGGTMDQKGDVDLAFGMQNGTGQVEFVFPVTASMTVRDITINNQISSQQRLTLTLPESGGQATVELRTIGGNQVITGPGGGTTGSVDSWMGVFIEPITVNGECAS